jgi:phenylacetate-CoA ligase
VPDDIGASLLAIQHQLEESQWLAAEELERRQFLALSRVLQHACWTVPHYQRGKEYVALADSPALDAAQWTSLPVLTREDVQEAGAAITTDAVPEGHLPLTEVFTSGSTGRPLRGVGTRVTTLFWLAITLRDHLWQGRDFTAKMAAIRPDPRSGVPVEGVVIPGWGPATDHVYETGPCALQSIHRDVKVQAAWLVGQDPVYLLTVPSNVLALARHFQSTGERLPSLREVRCYGELLGPEVRAACREAWDVDVSDMYSTQEIGYIALQCPEGDQYHVQSEVVYVELLDERGRPCGPGETGRVVVSTLHNFAMPLLRYDVGDYAEMGSPCACGRGLPVLNRVVGRTRNMLLMPTGERFWPIFGAAWREMDAVRQFQLAQLEIDHIEARIVGPRPLTAEEESRFATVLRERFGYPFHVTFRYLDTIDRSETLKFEDFVCLIAEEHR